MSIIFPRPFAIAIDDLGWIQGANEGESGYGPYRTGMPRNHTLDDYKAVVDLAKRTGVRLLGLFILGEMDRENFLGQFPHTTYLQENWDNTANISDLQIEMMEYVKANAAHLEFGLHGVGHEFWPEKGKRRRAEWYNTTDNHPWPEKLIREHVECFIRIMKQYGMTEENGHSFPESFVPCAYSYYWNALGDYSTGSVLADYGVRFANTDFSQIPECSPPEGDNAAGFDHNVHVMNRYNYGNRWFEIGKTPTVPLSDQPTDYIETHWPNLLAQEQADQEAVTQKWVEYYENVAEYADRHPSRNTAQHHAQWLYKQHTLILEDEPGKVLIDNQNMPDQAYPGSLANLVLKIKLDPGQHVSSAKIGDKTIPAYFEQAGYGILFLPTLLQESYLLEYTLGQKTLSRVIWHDTTATIFDLISNEKEVKIEVCLYGQQTLRLIGFALPQKIGSHNSSIQIVDFYMDKGFLCIETSAHNMQGEHGSIVLTF